MKKLLLVSLFLSHLYLTAQVPSENYPVDSASVLHNGILKGEIIKLVFDSSKIFPGTTRDLSIYVPAQYNPAQPACVYVNQDGILWNAPVVFDNLIDQK